MYDLNEIAYYIRERAAVYKQAAATAEHPDDAFLHTVRRYALKDLVTDICADIHDQATADAFRREAGF